VVLGALLGLLAARATFFGVWTLVPWGVAAVALGYRAPIRTAATAGTAYGFVLGVTFMLAVYTGAEPVVRKLAGFGALGLVAAACGSIASVAGAWFSRTPRGP